MAERGPFHVRIDRPHDRDGGWERWLAGRPGVRCVGEGPLESVFLVPARSPSSVARGERIPVRALRANIGADRISRAADDDAGTFWSSDGTQTGREEIVLDLGEERAVEAVVLSLGGALVRDFPRALRIEVSSDERHWSPAWEGATAAATVSAGLADPGVVPVPFRLGNVGARFIRLSQLGTDPVFAWSIAEIQVFAAANAAAR